MATIAIKDVRIFDGKKTKNTGTVVIEDGLISAKTEGHILIDGTGCTLLPGLIDSHIHLYSIQDLELSAQCGVTTMLDMSTRSADVVDGLKNRPGLTSILSCYLPAFAPGSPLIAKMGYPKQTEIKNADDAIYFVNKQLSCGADYIKIILEQQGVSGEAEFPVELVAAIVEETHRHNKLVIAHTVSPITYKSAIETGVDVLTHIPFAMPLPQPIVNTAAASGRVSVPTMIMMKGIVEKIKKVNPQVPFNFEFVKQSVTALHKAGVKILAGTDANVNDPTTPCSVPHGFGMYDELALLVEAELTPLEALQSATSEPAEYFGLNDRGIIEPGRRADLILVEGDPTLDIANIRRVRNVWINGIPVKR